MSAYWYGLLTLPTLVLVLAALFFAWLWADMALERHGINFTVRWKRIQDERVSDFLLRHDVWWERSFGPVFAGGWYHEKPVYREPTTPARINRWVGIGRGDGPCLYVVRSRQLGPVTTRTTPPGSTAPSAGASQGAAEEGAS